MNRARRGLLAARIILGAGALLVISLFLVWSHQLSPPVIARYAGTGAFAGVPRDPDGWQVYSTADVGLALVAAGFGAVALRGGRTARLVLAGALAIALAFVAHALATPPTNGATVFAPSSHPPAYATTAATDGIGETVALVALAVGAAGLALSFTAEA